MTRRPWNLTRVLFLLAGSVVLVGLALSVLINPWFLLLVAFVAVNQLVFVALGDCPTSLVLRRLGVDGGCR